MFQFMKECEEFHINIEKAKRLRDQSPVVMYMLWTDLNFMWTKAVMRTWYIYYGGELFTGNSLAIRTITVVSIKDYVFRFKFDCTQFYTSHETV
jgi:hypothetical protein